MDKEIIPKVLLACHEKQPINYFGSYNGKHHVDYTFPILLLDIAVVISISRIVRFLMKPLRQPRVVSDIIKHRTWNVLSDPIHRLGGSHFRGIGGMLMYGVIIGPSFLGSNKKFRAYMFPDSGMFVIHNIAIMGFMYFLFVSGVKMDMTIIFKAKKKHWYISTIGVAVPLATSVIVSYSMRKSLGEELGTFTSLYGISTTIAITAFPALYPVVRELNLMSSDIGRLAVSLTVISDIIGMHGVVLFEAAKQGEGKSMAALWYTISFVVVMGFIVGGIRFAMDWIVRATPEGKQVEQFYVVAILLGVSVVGFVTDMFGLAICNGPLWLGLAVPDGPPLGATISQKCETIVMEILLPVSYAYVGMVTDISSMNGLWTELRPLFYMAVLGCLTKLSAILLTCRFFNMTYRDSLALALVMSIRGQVELIMFVHWMDLKMIGRPQFTMLVLLTVAVTGIATPLISLVYDPTRPYMVDKRRNIQHTAPNAELQIIACIYDEKNVGGITKLLEVSNPTMHNPFSVHALHITELIGRAAPVFIDHQDEEHGDINNSQSKIHNALKRFHKGRDEEIKMHYYTSVSPRRSMYQDICEVALSKKASLIILPYHKDQAVILPGTEVVREGVQSVNFNVLKHAPCSVAILVEKLAFTNIFQNRRKHSVYRFVVLFLGGPDSREALTYADRMAGNVDVELTVVRFLSDSHNRDDIIEKKLDDGIVTWFWVKNEGNNRVTYREVVVRNGEQTVAAIHAINNDHFDLWIMGRKQGINPVILNGLSSWYQNHELGAVGDFVASSDLGSSGSVLVVHQQILRGQDLASTKFLYRLSFGKQPTPYHTYK